MPRGKVPSAFLIIVRMLRESSTTKTVKPDTILLLRPLGPLNRSGSLTRLPGKTGKFQRRMPAFEFRKSRLLDLDDADPQGRLLDGEIQLQCYPRARNGQMEAVAGRDHRQRDLRIRRQLMLQTARHHVRELADDVLNVL